MGQETSSFEKALYLYNGCTRRTYRNSSHRAYQVVFKVNVVKRPVSPWYNGYKINHLNKTTSKHILERLSGQNDLMGIDKATVQRVSGRVLSY